MQYLFLVLLGAWAAFHLTELLWAVVGLVVLLPFIVLFIYLDDKRTNKRISHNNRNNY